MGNMILKFTTENGPTFMLSPEAGNSMCILAELGGLSRVGQIEGGLPEVGKEFRLDISDGSNLTTSRVLSVETVKQTSVLSG